MRQKSLLILLLSGFLSFQLQAQSIVGTWKTVDDVTGKTKSLIKIYEAQNGKVYGKVEKILDTSNGEDPLCTLCPGDRKNKKILGMVLIRDMVKSGDVWKDGKILDPENGKEYSCKLWVENGQLKVRGYWGVFYRTQTWFKS
ncbi:MAG: DUF2147 domain-containing protein [Microscillaceae bacterium]|nr:DUF2147 domain-containing protein [Microscillaceae bacterium]